MNCFSTTSSPFLVTTLNNSASSWRASSCSSGGGVDATRQTCAAGTVRPGHDPLTVIAPSFHARMRTWLPRLQAEGPSLGRERVQPLFVHEVLVARVLEQLHVLLRAAIQQHAHLPRPGEHVGVFEGDLVVDVLGTGPRIPLDDMER